MFGSSAPGMTRSEILPRSFDTPLPIDAVLDELSRMLDKHDSAVLVAPPGAGKTTRVPLALLDEPWTKGKRIIVLEPRRIAARAAAERMAAPLRASAEQGRQAAWGAGATRQSAAGAAGGAGAAAGAPAGSAPDAMPAWARDLQSTQTARHHRQMAIHALQSGDRGGHGATPDIDEKD